MWHVCGRREFHTGFWRANLKATAHLNHLGVDGKILLIFVLHKSVGSPWTGFNWLRMRIRGGIFLK
jgi:hypothetical protein